MVVDGKHHKPMVNHQNKKNDYVEMVVDNAELDLLVPKMWQGCVVQHRKKTKVEKKHEKDEKSRESKCCFGFIQRNQQEALINDDQRERERDQYLEYGPIHFHCRTICIRPP